MKNIFQLVRYGIETLYIYLYLGIAILAGFVVYLFLSFLPKKKEENFTFDGYDL